MDEIRFGCEYANFTKMLDDIERIKSHYIKHNLIVKFDIFPQILRVNYEVSKQGQRL